MATSRDLAMALAKSKLWLTPIEEHTMLMKLKELDVEIARALDDKKEVIEPYEFS